MLTSEIPKIIQKFPEFNIERRTLWQDVLPDLQNLAFQSNFDLEFCDVPLENGELTNSVAEHVLQMWKDNPRSWIVVRIGFGKL